MIIIKKIIIGPGQTVLMPFNELGEPYCPICGIFHKEDPAYDLSGANGWGICPHCGVEFGVDDGVLPGQRIGDIHKKLRREWLEATGFKSKDLNRLYEVFGIEPSSWKRVT